MAFDESQLFLTYQPRWNWPRAVVGPRPCCAGGATMSYLVPPDRFIPVAEQSGLIVGMGSWLLQIALLALQRFRAAGFPNMHMAVNVSPVQLRQAGFWRWCRRHCGKRKAKHRRWRSRSPSPSPWGLEPVIEILTRLREMGSTVAIDDFGTGYSVAVVPGAPAGRSPSRLTAALCSRSNAMTTARALPAPSLRWAVSWA